MNKITIYVGMGLTTAPPEFRDQFQAELKSKLLTLENVEIFDFIGLKNGTAAEVFRHDRHCTETADLCVFIVDHASTGLGMEIVLRHFVGKPAVFFAANGQNVTRMLTGFLAEKAWPLNRYDSAQAIVDIVGQWLTNQKGEFWP